MHVELLNLCSVFSDVMISSLLSLSSLLLLSLSLSVEEMFELESSLRYPHDLVGGLVWTVA